MDHIIKKQVSDFRLKHKLKRFEAIKTHELLKTLDVLTVFLPCNPLISGMALKTGTHRFVMINSQHAVGRQNFTICHEIYHLFVQEDFTSAQCATGTFDKKDKNEYAADLFATYLMMPEDTVYGNIPEEEFENKKISYETIINLEQKLGCSHTALLFRLKNLGIISAEQYNEMKADTIISKAAELGFDADLYKAGNENKIIGDYEVLARKLFDKEKISESNYISLLQDIFKEV
jgi:Zn-dependent peptidase ImmA (M78 family)